MIITKLADLGVPSWLLKIVIGFLSNRKLEVKFRGANSEVMKMPGGGPQGTISGMFIFIILISPINFSQKLSWGKEITTKMSERKAIKNLHMKFVDDLSLLESVNLKKDLIKEDRVQTYPL